MTVPEQLEPFLEKIVKIDKVEGVPKAVDSYMGGYPFVPDNGKDWDWPKTLENKPLIFVLQINFKDVPKDFGYPEIGLLQIFIDYTGYYGTDYRAGLKVILYDGEILKLESCSNPSDITPKDEDDYTIFCDDSPKKIEFREGYQIPPEQYIECSGAIYSNDSSELDGKAKELYELLVKNKVEIPEYLVSHSHQLGGEADWIQGSPLEEMQCDSSFILQIAEDDDLGFGDAGNMHVWGSLEKLCAGDVSDFQWEWACC